MSAAISQFQPAVPRNAAGHPIRLAVLFGGRSEEHSISCLSAASVLRSLDPTKYTVTAVGITADGRWYEVSPDPEDWQRVGDTLPTVTPTQRRVHAEELEVDVVFPVLHGPYGEDGTVQGLLEMVELPYVGSGVLASALTMDKHASKRMLSAYGIPVGDFVAFDSAKWRADRAGVEAEVTDSLKFPVFVKPTRMGSSIGISKVRSIDELAEAVERALHHDNQVLVEASVEQAREIECGILEGGLDAGPAASVCAEVKVSAEHDFYDFTAKYLDGSTQLAVPAELAEEQSEMVRELALRAFVALGCAGLARVDFFLAADGQLVVNEVNTMPGFTDMSLFPQMWRASGVSYSSLVDHLIAQALTATR